MNLEGIHPAYKNTENRSRPGISWSILSFYADKVDGHGDHRRGASHAYVEFDDSGHTVTADLAPLIGHNATRMIVEVVEEPASISVVQWRKTQAELLSVDPSGLEYSPDYVLELPHIMLDLARTLRVASASQPK